MKDAIEQLAQLVVQSNAECYKSIKLDDPAYAKDIERYWPDYGVDYDTVQMILDGIITDVAKRAREIQNDNGIPNT